MATEAQIKANRQNALKSTGPRTQEGKEIVSQNATKHGLCSCKNVIRSESQEEYNLFRDEMIADLSPVGAMEHMLAERIVSLSWRLKRAEIYQNSVMEVLIDERLNETWQETRGAREQAKEGDMSLIIGLAIRRDFADCRTLDLLLMYERRIESSLYKATSELRKIQKLRNKQKEGTAWAEAHTTQPNYSTKHEEIYTTNSEKQSQFSENHPHSDKTNQDEAATQGRKMTDEGRCMIDKSDSVKHPASLESYAETSPASSQDYLSRRSPLAQTNAGGKN